jgi:hypothetical protein
LSEETFEESKEELNIWARDLMIWTEDEDILKTKQDACIADTTQCFTITPDADAAAFLLQVANHITALSEAIELSAATIESSIESGDIDTYIADNFGAELA